ncbi:tetratricopeptide repeat protein [Thermodesulfovibrio hydrogeniphilus]
MKNVEHVETFKEKLFAQKKNLLKALLIFGVSVVLILGFYIYKIKQESDAKELEYQAYQYYFGFVKNVSAEQRFSKAAQLFTEAYGKKKNLTYLLNAGYAYEASGQKDKAIEILNKVASSNDPYFTNLAKVKIAMTYLKNNEQDKAIQVLNEIINGNSDTLKDFALFQLAKIYEKDNKEQAQKYYDTLVNKYPASPFTALVKTSPEQKEK